MSEIKHTELPWKIERDEDKQYHITSDFASFEHIALVNKQDIKGEDKANAALIVHRVNTWDKLVSNIEKAKALISSNNKVTGDSLTDRAVKECNVNRAWHLLEQAITLVEATKP